MNDDNTVKTESHAEQYESLPHELKAIAHWVGYSLGPSKGNGKRDKFPINPHTGKKGAVNNPATLGTFEQAVAASDRYGLDGVGFVFTDSDDICGIDLDHCRDADSGVIEQWAIDTLQRFPDAYWETSPSETGFHAILRGQLPPGRRKKGNVEVYDAGRFFTMTGHYYTGEALELPDCTETLIAWHTEVFGTHTPDLKIVPTPADSDPPQAETKSDKQLLANWGVEYKKLWDGDISAYPSPSEADLALCSKLAHRGATGTQIERLISQSGLNRDKWADRPDYRQLTIRKALSGLSAPQTPVPSDAAEPETPPSGLPEIVTTDRQLRDITRDAIAALQGQNDPPFLYLRSAQLSRIQIDEQHQASIEFVTDNMLRGYLTECADFVTVRQLRQALVRTATSPPMDAVKTILAKQPLPFPPLANVITAPVVRPDGSILLQPGYDSTTMLFYHPHPDLVLPSIPNLPTQEDIDAAVQYIRTELLTDFPFEAEADEANFFGCLLTPLVRPLIDGNVPLALIDKPTPGSGATLLSDLVSSLAIGQPGAKQILPKGKYADDETRKTLTSVLLDGTPVVTFDNVEEAIQSGPLSMALTTTHWKDRLMGGNKTITLPVRCTWIATGNNLKLRGDFARRSYLIRIDPEQERPWERQNFRHADLLGWVTAHRGELLSALLTLIRGWFAAGEPASNTPVLGSYGEWTHLLGGVLTHAGIKEFLTNQADLYDVADDDAHEWRVFFAAWRAAFDDSAMTVGEILDDSRLIEALPPAIKFDPTLPRQARTRLSRALGKRKGRILDNHRLERGEDKHTKSAKWSLGTIEHVETEGGVKYYH